MTAIVSDIAGLIAREVQAAVGAERARMEAEFEREKAILRTLAVADLESQGYTVVPPVPRSAPHGLPKSDPEKFARLTALVESGHSFNEIRKTLGTDMRTVKRYFPDYRPFPLGGGGDAQVIRQVNQDLNRMGSDGTLGRRRERS